MFESRVEDIFAVKEALARFEFVTGANINCEKMSSVVSLEEWFSATRSLQLGEWSDKAPRGLVRVRAPDRKELVGGTGKGRNKDPRVFSKAVVLKKPGRGLCHVHSPLILYQLSVLPLPGARLLALERDLFRFLWKGRRSMVRRHICSQRPCNGGIGMLNLTALKDAERLTFLYRSITQENAWQEKIRAIFPAFL